MYKNYCDVTNGDLVYDNLTLIAKSPLWLGQKAFVAYLENLGIFFIIIKKNNNKKTNENKEIKSGVKAH